MPNDQQFNTTVNLQVAAHGEEELVRILQHLDELHKLQEGASTSASAENRALAETIRLYEQAAAKVKDYADLVKRAQEAGAPTARDIGTLSSERQLTEESLRMATMQFQYYRRMFPESYTKIGQTSIPHESDQGMFEWFRRATGETMSTSRSAELGLRQDYRTNELLDRDDRRRQREEERAAREEERRWRQSERDERRRMREEESEDGGGRGGFFGRGARAFGRSIMAGAGISLGWMGTDLIAQSVNEYIQRSREFSLMSAASGGASAVPGQAGARDVDDLVRNPWRYTQREVLAQTRGLRAIDDVRGNYTVGGNEPGAMDLEWLQMFARSFGMEDANQLLPAMYMQRRSGGDPILAMLDTYAGRFGGGRFRVPEYLQTFSQMEQMLSQRTARVDMQSMMGVAGTIGGIDSEFQGETGFRGIISPLMQATMNPQGEYREALLYQMLSEDKGRRMKPWEFEMAKAEPQKYMDTWVNAALRMAYRGMGKDPMEFDVSSLSQEGRDDFAGQAGFWLQQLTGTTSIGWGQQMFQNGLFGSPDERSNFEAFLRGDTGAGIAGLGGPDQAEETRKRAQEATSSAGMAVNQFLDQLKQDIGGWAIPDRDLIRQMEEGVDGTVVALTRHILRMATSPFNSIISATGAAVGDDGPLPMDSLITPVSAGPPVSAAPGHGVFGAVGGYFNDVARGVRAITGDDDRTIAR